jgi:hypothetical protein
LKCPHATGGDAHGQKAITERASNEDGQGIGKINLKESGEKKKSTIFIFQAHFCPVTLCITTFQVR